LNINGNTIELFCVHLAAGNGTIANEQWMMSLKQFMNLASNKPCDAVFYFGDMNFRNNDD